MNPETVSLAEAMRRRRSVRGFLDKPVADEILRQVFELAQLAPSNCNIQPWKAFVASGEVRDELRRRMVEKVSAGVPMEPDFEPNAGRFEGIYRQRQVDCAGEM